MRTLHLGDIVGIEFASGQTVCFEVSEDCRRRQSPLPADAMRAIRMAIQERRVTLGEPTDRTAVSVEETIRREYERWMVVAEPEEATGEDGDTGHSAGGEL